MFDPSGSSEEDDDWVVDYDDGEWSGDYYY